MSYSTENKTPSIFNDVIGPLMRGPSSSHCAAAWRSGRILVDLMGGNIQEVTVRFDPNESLATTHSTQGSDMGLVSALLGYELTDAAILDYQTLLEQSPLKLNYQLAPIPVKHTAAYDLTATNEREQIHLVSLSTGGGMVEIVRLDGFELSMKGDYFETFVWTSDRNLDALTETLTRHVEAASVEVLSKGNSALIRIKCQRSALAQITANASGFEIAKIKEASPVVPILSQERYRLPFTCASDFIEVVERSKKPLWQHALDYESARGGILTEEVFEKMRFIHETIRDSLERSKTHQSYSDRILGQQSDRFLERLSEGRLVSGGTLNQILYYNALMMETKSAMGVLVAAPTAGSCGSVPGVIFGFANGMGSEADVSEDNLVKGWLAAGLMGVLIAADSTFLAEDCGCQAECGNASGMAAAALTTLMGGTSIQSVNAASMALQNLFGLVCDPVASRVEVPCLGKNALAASNAFNCANMALADFDPVIPLDEVIVSMDQVGRSLPAALRCTALGGLSITPTSKKLGLALNRNNRNLK